MAYNEVITLYELMIELETWGHFSEEEKEKAIRSGFNTKNSANFTMLIRRFRNGYYDNDIDSLIQIVKNWV